jgi:hypothetical protein
MEQEPKKFKSAGTPQEVKEYRAELALALEGLGVPLQTFLLANDKTRFPMSEASLYRHVQSLRSRRPPLSAEKHAGRPPTLSNEQQAVLAGAFLCSKDPVDLEWAQAWIMRNFNANVSVATVSRILGGLHLSRRLLGGRALPKDATFESYVQEYYEFVLARHKDRWFQYNPRKIVCVDFVTNSRRLERQTTFQVIRSKQKKISAPKPKYTNSYLVAVCLEDVGQYPALMFTYDPFFDPKGTYAQRVKFLCQKWNIARDRIVYQKSAATYCKESSDQVAHFKDQYRAELRGTRVFHDTGNSFKIRGEYVLADGADRHMLFPPMTHGELSVLDNKLFAVAKNQWKSERPVGNFSEQDLYLLWCIDWATNEAIRSYWNQNFMLAVEKPSLQLAADFLKGKNNSARHLEEDYISAYEEWKHNRGEVIEEEELQALESNLDGVYWTK